MRRQTVERLKAAASAMSYVRVTASGGHVSSASVGVEVCFQGTSTWLMAAVRGRGAGGWWKDGGSARRKAARQTVWKDTPYKEMKGRCVFFHPLWAETSCPSLTPAQLDSPGLRWFWTPGHKATGGAQFVRTLFYGKQSEQNPIMSLL